MIVAAVGADQSTLARLQPSPDKRSEAKRFIEALHPRLMAPRLAAALDSRPRACHVLDAKYEAGVRAVVLYQFGDDLVRGDLSDAQSSTPPSVPMVAPGLRLSTFPDDPDLPTLPGVMDGAHLGRLLSDAIPAMGDPPARAYRVSLLRYRPGKRATVLLTQGAGQPPMVGKVYHDPLKAAAVATEAAALRAATESKPILRIAPTLAHVPELNLVVQRSVQGISLEWLLAGSTGRDSAAARAVHRAGRALAELHRAPMASARERSTAKELHRFVVRAERVATADPIIGAQLLALAERLLEAYARLGAGPTGLVHGDCKPGQFLLDGDQVVLLDFDHCGVAEPAGDVGTFAASLRQLSIRRGLSRPVRRAGADVAELGGVFTEAYLGSRADSDLHQRILFHEVVALERKALRAFARAPMSGLPSALVSEGHRCLARALGGTS